MTDKQITEIYAARKMTIREMAEDSGRSYSSVRKVLISAGYCFGKKM